MARDKELHHENIISAATAEFLEHGFKDASMRRIASAVGMSVSGLYKHFAGKEEMFSALVEPAYQGLMALYSREVDSQMEVVRAGNLSVWDNGKDARLTVTYVYEHLDAFRLMICKAQGTKYETFLHDFAVLEEQTVLYFMNAVKSRGFKLKDFSEKELHLLITVNINAIFQTVEHGFSLEEALHYADTLDRFFSAAWKEFFGY